MKMNKLVKGGLAAVMCLALAACESGAQGGGSSEQPAGDTGYTAAGDLSSYTIGTGGPTSGDLAVYGGAVTNAAALAVKDWNEAHGTNIKCEIQDTTGDATQAVNIYNKFVSDTKVAGIIGMTVSGESIAVAGASADTMVPIISPSATAEAFTANAGANVFRACYTDPQQAALIADFAYDTLGLRKAAVLYNSDDDYSVGLCTSFEEEFQAKGGELALKSEAFGTDDTNFSTQLTKIAAAQPDVLFIPNYYEKDVMIATQARDLGIEAQFIGCDGWDGVLEVASASDLAALEGAVFINQYSPDMESVQAIMEEYQAEYGQSINSFGINSYDATMCLLEAIEAANSLNAADINAQLAKIEHQGILGTLKFDETGDPIKTPVYVTIKDGKYVSYGK